MPLTAPEALAVGELQTIAVVAGPGAAEEYFGRRLVDGFGDRVVAWLTPPQPPGAPRLSPPDVSARNETNRMFGLRARLGIRLLQRRSPRPGRRVGVLAAERARLGEPANHGAKPRQLADIAETAATLDQLAASLVVCSPAVDELPMSRAGAACLRLTLGMLSDGGDATAVLRALERSDLDGVRSTVSVYDRESGDWRVAKTSTPCLAADDTPQTLVERCYLLGANLVCSVVAEAMATGRVALLPVDAPSERNVGHRPDPSKLARLFRDGLAPRTLSQWVEF